MRILLAGASGLVGSALIPVLKEAGHDLFFLTRTPKEGGFLWHPEKGEIDLTAFEQVDALINLAGENIATGRWTKKKKESILKSRVDSTALLAKSLLKLQKSPRVWINASATGYYGSVIDREVTETCENGSGFLAEVCREWERAAEPVLRLPTRLILLRTGVVLSKNGGALKKMVLPFQWGLGGIIGSGLQEMSWIDLDDLTRVILYCLEDEHLRGPVNATSPHAVSQTTFTKILGRTLHRPTFFWLPAALAKLLFGQMAEEMLLSSLEAHPYKLLKSGFQFSYPDIESSLKHQLE